jgi:hypothetical protein
MDTNLAQEPRTMSRNTGMLLALVPWAAFSVLANHGGGAKLAAVVGLIAAVAIAVRGVAEGRPKILEIGAAASFVVITAVAFSLSPDAAADFARYARGLSAGMLAVIAFSSLLFTPFTEQYARDFVPERLWGSPTFKAVNRKLTALWGAVFAAMVPMHMIAGSIDTRRSNIIFNWVLPALLVMWAMKRSTADTDAPAAVVHA